MINGEFWINGNQIEYAEGDYNHEGLAIHHIFDEFGESIINLARDQGIDVSEISNTVDGFNQDEISDLIDQLLGNYASTQYQNSPQVLNLMQEIGANADAFKILRGGGNASLYVMVYEEWIAIRRMSIELFGYNERKRKILLNGLFEILESEGCDFDNPSLNNLEFEMYDHKTKRATDLTLSDIENPAPVLRPQQMPVGKQGDRRFPLIYSDKTENLPKQPQLEPKVNQWKTAAQQANLITPGQDLWRGTSESFSTWIKIPDSVFTLLRGSRLE